VKVVRRLGSALAVIGVVAMTLRHVRKRKARARSRRPQRPELLDGGFELNADFFAAVPYRNAVQIRIQSGSDFQTFSDGLLDPALRHHPSEARPDQAVCWKVQAAAQGRISHPK